MTVSVANLYHDCLPLGLILECDGEFGFDLSRTTLYHLTSPHNNVHFINVDCCLVLE